MLTLGKQCCNSYSGLTRMTAPLVDHAALPVIALAFCSALENIAFRRPMPDAVDKSTAREGSDMDGRRAIGARLRFEVFKRDSFTCQYCGRKAPDVILQCDHVTPVTEGGETDILNLITSCRECNGGKGGIPLSDHMALDKQRETLEELQQRREQLDMMIRWRDELRAMSEDVLDAIVDRIAGKTDGYFGPNESGMANLRRWWQRFTVAEILAAVDVAFDAYLTFDRNKPNEESWERAFQQIPRFIDIARQEKEKPYIRRLLYIQGIIRKRARARRYQCVDYLEHLFLCGADLDDMERRAKALRSLEDFERPYDAWLERIGKPF